MSHGATNNPATIPDSPAFGRCRTFLWFSVALAAYCVSEDLRGISSFVRALGLQRFSVKMVSKNPCWLKKYLMSAQLFSCHTQGSAII